MRGGNCGWLAGMLAVAAVVAIGAGAMGQDQWTGGYYWVSSPRAAAPGNVSYAGEAAPDLAARVSELEATVRKMTEAQEKAKEKAEEKAAGKLSLKLGGRFYWDWAMFDQGALNAAQIGNSLNGFELRRARLFVGGEGFRVIEYMWEVDWANDEVSVKDMYLGVKELPILGTVRVGQFKEPFSLEELTSSKYITFMERAMVVDLLAPGRHVGVMATNYTENERATLSMGAFATGAGPQIRDDDQATSFTMRATWLPCYDQRTQGRGLLHTGVSWSYQSALDDQFTLAARPEADLSQRVVDVDVLNVEHVNTLGLETALVFGPFSVQSEYISGWLSPIGGGDEYGVNGLYIYASYFLTGENRVYDRKNGCFSRVKPFEDFIHVRTCDGCRVTGKGAWEVAYRYSELDLDDGAILGGVYHTHTLGLNWYLNPYTRMMLNYVHLDMDPRNADFPGNSQQNAFMMRAQIDF